MNGQRLDTRIDESMFLRPFIAYQHDSDQVAECYRPR